MAEPDADTPVTEAPVRTVLQVFYSATCNACSAELPVLAKVQEDNAVDLVIIVLGDRDKGYAALKQASPRLVEIATAASVSTESDILRAAGNATGKLPYARTLLSTGLVCQTWEGGLTTGVLDRMLESCRLKSEGLPGKPATN
jgi:hypothetical protein